MLNGSILNCVLSDKQEHQTIQYFQTHSAEAIHAPIAWILRHCEKMGLKNQHETNRFMLEAINMALDCTLGLERLSADLDLWRRTALLLLRPR